MRIFLGEDLEVPEFQRRQLITVWEANSAMVTRIRMEIDRRFDEAVLRTPHTGKFRDGRRGETLARQTSPQPNLDGSGITRPSALPWDGEDARIDHPARLCSQDSFAGRNVHSRRSGLEHTAWTQKTI